MRGLTKLQLLAQMEIARRWALKPIFVVSKRVSEQLRRRKDFLPSSEYPSYITPLQGEVGSHFGVRILLQPPRWAT